MKAYTTGGVCAAVALLATWRRKMRSMMAMSPSADMVSAWMLDIRRPRPPAEVFTARSTNPLITARSRAAVAIIKA